METQESSVSYGSSAVLVPTPSSDEGDEASHQLGETSHDRKRNKVDKVGDGHREIPRTGLEFFEYRRALFLSNTLPARFPEYVRNSTLRIPAELPEPLPAKVVSYGPDSAVVRLEKLMSATPRGEETDQAWRSGIENVFRQLNAGKKLAAGVRLGLVIKILRASWIQDGTWPRDPKTKRAYLPPPDSPRPTGPLSSYPPRPCSPVENLSQAPKRPAGPPRTASGGPATMLNRMARMEREASLNEDDNKSKKQ